MRLSVFAVALIAIVLGLGTDAAWGQDKEPSHQGKTLTEWTQRLKTTTGKERLQALQALNLMMNTAGIKPTPAQVAPAIPPIIEALKDPDPQVQLFAMSALRSVGPPAKDAVPALAVILKDKDPYKQRNAASVLEKIGPDAAAAVPALLEAAKGSDELTASIVCVALGKVKSKEATPALLEMVKARKSKAWPAAAAALWEIEKHPDAMPALLDGLKGTDLSTLSQCTDAVARVGPDAKAAVPALLENLKNNRARFSTESALKAVDPEAAKAAGVK